jgi:hypothetical protein
MTSPTDRSTLHRDLLNPPRECSLLPFWFWNDDLDEAELLRQIADFDAHGVYGFVIHPRIGLPRSIGWMSDAMLGFMSVALREAKRRDMKVLLYDEGMYPSGSSSGQVVASDPTLQCRGLAIQTPLEGTLPDVPANATVLAELTRVTGERVRVIERPIRSVIRGLHYLQEEPKVIEDEPLAGDILNPRTAEKVIELVYEKFFASFGSYFGDTVLGIFTDEPHALGRSKEKNVRPGTTGILDFASELVGYDLRPRLAGLWFDDEPHAKQTRRHWHFAIQRRLEQAWYAPLSRWCEARGVALCGHPAAGDELGIQRFFHFPGQDLVWRFVEPEKPSALEGHESTQGKVTSSAMLHLGRRRNSNEFCGAYGSQTTFEEFKWLADWCLVRGVNLLIPHAFYYSVRGPRRDERPPQVGPNSPWWDRFKPFADHCRRLSWVNTDSTPVCDVAILADPDHAPWKAARVCFEHQRDFNYLDPAMLLRDDAIARDDGLHLDGMHYRVLVLDGDDPLPPTLVAKLQPLLGSGQIVRYRGGLDPAARPDDGVATLAGEGDLALHLQRHAAADLTLDAPAPALRVRHVTKAGEHFYLLFNERSEPLRRTLDVSAVGAAAWIDTASGQARPLPSRPLPLELRGFELKLLHVAPAR